MRSIMGGRIARALAARARVVRVLAAIAVAGLTAAACDVHGISGPGSLTTLTISPTSTTLAINGTQQFVVVGTDFSGAVVDVTPSWSIVSGGGTISATGLFTAGTTPGAFPNTVRATSNGVSVTASVTVVAGPLATITVTPNPASLVIGATQQFTAVGRDASGNILPITPSWSVVASGGTINATTGLFTAGNTSGTFVNTVRASVGAIAGFATVTVTNGPLATITVTPNPASVPTGGTQQFTAVGKDAGGNILTITPVWSVVAGGGTIDPATGLFTAGTTTGTFVNTVKATSGAISGTATVTVTPVLTTITVTPNPATLQANGTQQFSAVGRDANGNAFPITPVWSVVNGGGTIDAATGLFTAGSTTGTFAGTVKATSGAVSGTATVTVTPVLATITVTPNPDTVQTNGTQQFSAVGRDASGNVFPISVVWSVVNGGGTIDAVTGLFTAGSTTGTFANTVRATSGTVSGSATVVVIPQPVLTTITVTPNPAVVQVNGTQQFTAVGRDQNGRVVPISPVFSVVNGGGTINAGTGLFTAGTTTGTFNNTVTATSGTVSGTATVTVTPVLATITVTPNPATVPANGTQQFTAVGRDALGNPIPISPVFSVVNGGGTIDSVTGLFRAGLIAGTFTNTVRATSGTISGSATVVVTTIGPAPLINLGSAAPNGIMAGQAFTCIAGGLINADIAISPGSTVTGFPPCVITGNQELATAIARQAQIDLTTAYNQLAGLPCPPANAIVANLGGTTKAAGVYCTASGIGITGTLTLDGGGDPNANFVFQAGTTLTTAGSIVLINGAQAKNVYFQVGSSATLGTASQIKGNILTLTSITLVDNANLIGRALARNGSVSLGTNNVITLP